MVNPKQGESLTCTNILTGHYVHKKKHSFKIRLSKQHTGCYSTAQKTLVGFKQNIVWLIILMMFNKSIAFKKILAKQTMKLIVYAYLVLISTTQLDYKAQF